MFQVLVVIYPIGNSLPGFKANKICIFSGPYPKKGKILKTEMNSSGILTVSQTDTIAF
jgi:hypothetical protein